MVSMMTWALPAPSMRRHFFGGHGLDLICLRAEEWAFVSWSMMPFPALSLSSFFLFVNWLGFSHPSQILFDVDSGRF